jgi:acetylornithine deacetylase
MMLDRHAIDRSLGRLSGEAVEFLCEMINHPSTRGNEGPVNRLIHQRFMPLCDRAELMPIPEDLKENPGYSWPLPGLSYDGTCNVRCMLNGVDPGRGRSLILNAHSDVVPPSKNQLNPFTPDVKDGIVFGRGACDDKGQIAVLYLVLCALKDLAMVPRGAITIDIVVEEENGGNGTFYATLHPVKADGAVVMEPTEMMIYSAVRGAVWFELNCFGRPGHSGRASDVVSALKEGIKAMQVLERYHDELLAASRGNNPLFDRYENPMPVTFGVMSAGDWPATAPATATLKGVFGFLPNSSVTLVQRGMTDAIRNSEHEWLKKNFELKFNMLNNEGNEIPPDHPMVAQLSQAAADAGVSTDVSAMTAACDAWRYNNILGIPTVVMGAGSLKYAHANNEQIAIEEIVAMARTLVYFIDRWCGLYQT